MLLDKKAPVLSSKDDAPNPPYTLGVAPKPANEPGVSKLAFKVGVPNIAGATVPAAKSAPPAAVAAPAPPAAPAPLNLHHLHQDLRLIMLF